MPMLAETCVYQVLPQLERVYKSNWVSKYGSLDKKLNDFPHMVGPTWQLEVVWGYIVQ